MTSPATQAAPPPLAAGDPFPYWRRNMYALALATFCLALGFNMVNPFLPLVLREMGARGHLETWVGYTQAGYLGLSFLLMPVWGVVADHYGRKLMVLRTSLGMGLVYSILPFAPTVGWFMGLYLLMGTTNGFVPSSQALVATNTPRQSMGRSLSLVQTGTLIGSAIGPAAGAVLASVLPAYRYLYWICSGLTLSAGLAALVFTRERHQRPATPFRPHLLRDLRRIMRIPGIRLLYYFQFCFALTYGGSTAIISVYALELLAAQGVHHGAGVDFWVAAISLCATVGSALAVPFWGRVLDRLGAPRVLLMALVCATLATVPIALVVSPGQLAGARFLLGVLAIGLGPASITMVRIYAPDGMESRVLAYGAACSALGRGTGPFLAGEIGPWLGLRAYFVLNTLLLLAGLLAWLRVVHRGHRPPVFTEE